jgi:hypothetical protein
VTEPSYIVRKWIESRLHRLTAYNKVNLPDHFALRVTDSVNSDENDDNDEDVDGNLQSVDLVKDESRNFDKSKHNFKKYIRFLDEAAHGGTYGAFSLLEKRLGFRYSD